jgi:hypothetical protein
MSAIDPLSNNGSVSPHAGFSKRQDFVYSEQSFTSADLEETETNELTAGEKIH